MVVTLKGNMLTNGDITHLQLHHDFLEGPGKDLSFGLTCFILRYEELHGMEKQVKLQDSTDWRVHPMGDETNNEFVMVRYTRILP